MNVQADLEAGFESRILVEGLGYLSLAVAKQLFADLDQEIARADAHDENQSTNSDRYDYHLAVA